MINKIFKKRIISSINKFNLNLEGKNVLTEAATGNYVVTSIISALAGANTIAFTKDSEYGDISDVKKQTHSLAEECKINEKIEIITSLDNIKLNQIDILTNTGFLRPIGKKIIDRLSSKCVIPLMYEPWEFRKNEIDLDECYIKGIKVYGTNENVDDLKTMDYLGYVVLSLLLKNKYSPFSSKILLIGCNKFINSTSKILNNNNYSFETINDYCTKNNSKNLGIFDVIVLMEHERNILLIGNKDSYIENKDINNETLVIHICGKVDFKGAKFRHIPHNPKPFGYMSYTADYADPQAVIDLHTAGLKVAEGMIKANSLNLKPFEYKNYLEKNYPALSFNDSKFW